MKNELESRFILSVFDKISKQGSKREDGYFLEGIKAYTDHDGYTLFFEDALVQLRFGFHNQYHYEYDKTEHLEQFLKKLRSIDAEF